MLVIRIQKIVTLVLTSPPTATTMTTTNHNTSRQSSSDQCILLHCLLLPLSYFSFKTTMYGGPFEGRVRGKASPGK